MKLGIYRLHEVIDEAGVSAIETECGLPLHMLSVYRAWNECRIEADLPWLERLRGSCRDLLLTWEPWRLPERSNLHPEQPDFSLEQLLSRRYDEYIRAFARVLSTFPQTIYLRPMHEMNGNWYPWCGRVGRNSSELFISAWHHIRDLFGGHVSTNIKWVWSPYALSFPDEPGNAITRYFPGDDAVDWVAVDGYNWGRARPEIGWQSFEQIFGAAYSAITAISRRPLMIAETGCAEEGGDKAQWVREAFASLKNRFGRVEILVWFDVDKECDWRMASSPESLNAFRNVA